MAWAMIRIKTEVKKRLDEVRKHTKFKPSISDIIDEGLHCIVPKGWFDKKKKTPLKF